MNDPLNNGTSIRFDICLGWNKMAKIMGMSEKYYNMTKTMTKIRIGIDRFSCTHLYLLLLTKSKN